VYTINNTLQKDVAIKQEEDDKCIEYVRTNLNVINVAKGVLKKRKECQSRVQRTYPHIHIRHKRDNSKYRKLILTYNINSKTQYAHFLRLDQKEEAWIPGKNITHMHIIRKE
jgi:hypothetical protein